MTKEEIITNLYNDKILNDIILNITRGHALSEDLKSELFLILLNMSDKKIKDAFKGRWINYLCINILKKQWNSKSSPFFVKYKKFGSLGSELFDSQSGGENLVDYESLDLIINIVDKLPFVEGELFKMRYKIGKYDKHFGALRDDTCKKDIYSFRKIEKKLAIQTINDDNYISIDHSTIERYHKRTIEKIKTILNDK